YLGVVEEIALHPKTGRRFPGPRTELLDDAGDSDELDLVGIADQDLVEQYRARRMIMCVDEPRHNRHLPGIECLRPLADQRLDVLGVPHGDKPAGFGGECLRPRLERIDRVDRAVENDEIGLRCGVERRSGRATWPTTRPPDKPGDTC